MKNKRKFIILILIAVTGIFSIYIYDHYIKNRHIESSFRLSGSSPDYLVRICGGYISPKELGCDVYHVKPLSIEKLPRLSGISKMDELFINGNYEISDLQSLNRKAREFLTFKYDGNIVFFNSFSGFCEHMKKIKLDVDECKDSVAEIAAAECKLCTSFYTWIYGRDLIFRTFDYDDVSGKISMDKKTVTACDMPKYLY